MDDIVLKTTRLQKILSIVTSVCMVSMIVLFIVQYIKLPEQIAVHYGFNGEVDRYGNKSEMIVLLVASIGIYLLLTLVARAPKMWNTAIEVTPLNKEKVYEICKDLLYMSRLFVVIMFFYIMECMLLEINLGDFFIVFMIVGLVLIIGGNLIRLFKLNK